MNVGRVSRRWASVLPESARVVVVGGGVVGCSVSYHISKIWGGADVVQLEKGQLTCGTTWHAAGLIGQMRATRAELELSKMGGRVLQDIVSETGQETGFRRRGSLTMARCTDRTFLLRKNAARAKFLGVTADILTPQEAKKLFPLLDASRFDSALWLPDDGVANPTDAAMAFHKGGKQRGVRTFEGVEVTGFSFSPCGAVRGVHVTRTVDGVKDKTTIACQHVVICAGLWSQRLGRLAGVNIPLHPCQHFYVVTEPLAAGMVTPDHPFLRDPDSCAYYREWSGGLLVGGFEYNALPCFVKSPPSDFEFGLFEDNYDHFSPVLEDAMEAMPALNTTPIRTMVNGPESFTPDNQYIMGPAPGIPGFWVAAGMNSSGIAASSGVGWSLAEWLTSEQQTPPIDTSAVDIARFGPGEVSRNFVRRRATETLGMHYKLPYPRMELTRGRPVRKSPLYSVHQQQGAVFGTTAGWERPNYFLAPGEEKGVETFGRPSWQDAVNREFMHTLKAASIFDLSSQAKLCVHHCDPAVLIEALQHLCHCDVAAVTPGTFVKTLVINPKGNAEATCTLLRIDVTSFMLLLPSNSGERVRRLLHRYDCPAVDVTSAYGMLSLQGPEVRRLLRLAAYESCDEGDFPLPQQGGFQRVDIGNYSVKCLQVSGPDELSRLDLLMPMEMLEGVHATLCGLEKGVFQEAGYYCSEALRVLQKHTAWGADFGAGTPPGDDAWGVWAGDAVPRPSPTRMVGVTLTPGDTQTMLWGGEVLCRDGEEVALLTSGVFLPIPFNTSAALASVRLPSSPAGDDWLSSGTWSVNISGAHHPATVHCHPLIRHSEAHSLD